MRYQTNELAKLAGVSQRTIRFYENEGLLVAQRDPENNYRSFASDQVDRLQQILFYRELGLPLAQIKQILLAPDFNILQALQEQEQALLAQQTRIAGLLALVQRTLDYQKGALIMSDQEKFAAFKAAQVTNNEQAYGPEIRQKYGDAQVERANQQWLARSAAAVQQMQQLEQQVFAGLRQLLGPTTPDLDSSGSQQVFAAHRAWVRLAWGQAKPYSAEAHRGLAAMYAADPRFIKYYDDAAGPGATALLVAIIDHYAR
ncbi:MerR family transcriptional regulator [Lapidilactobacillus achengensis]|uniref:MerR family transcriptional regulator n=1 Tax=Lapidilactobacillus achengensis TaxID=2486000 RepID=A0ABW1UNX0_9LACO|nr:MerR family transcriptional regulator [Lapidilactobacillus achengensis]